MVYSQNKARELLSLIGEYHSNLLTRLGFFGKMDDEQKGVFDGVHYLVDKLRGWIGARDSREKTTAYKVLVKAKWFKDEEHAKRFLDNLAGIPILIRQDNKYRLCIRKRPGNVDDIANAVLFLSGNESKYITGHILTVDGGWTCNK